MNADEVMMKLPLQGMLLRKTILLGTPDCVLVILAAHTVEPNTRGIFWVIYILNYI